MRRERINPTNRLAEGLERAFLDYGFEHVTMSTIATVATVATVVMIPAPGPVISKLFDAA